MEEILASIRRIIADDQSLPMHARAPAATMADDADDVTPASATTTGDMVVPPQPVEPTAAQIAPASASAAPRDATLAAQSVPVEQAAAGWRGVAVEPGADAFGRVEAPRDSDQPPPRPAIEEDAVPEPDLEMAAEPASLFSEATDHSVTAAFNVLAASRIADQSDELLQLVRGMVRPLLKAWIDENVPAMVERMIRAEIERMTRGGR